MKQLTEEQQRELDAMIDYQVSEVYRIPTFDDMPPGTIAALFQQAKRLAEDKFMVLHPDVVERG
jgi:hypothetical protein